MSPNRTPIISGFPGRLGPAAAQAKCSVSRNLKLAQKGTMIELVRRPGYKSRLPNCQHRGISRPDSAIGFAIHHLAWGSAVPTRRRGLGLGYGAAALPPPQGPSQLTAQGRLGGQRMICKFASRHRRPPLPARRFLASLSLKAATVVARPTPGDVGRAARHGGHANRRSLLRLRHSFRAWPRAGSP